MDIHYHAFISYRHHPDDIRVAEQIHKGLEHFKVPKSIKKRSTPMRLFRDKEELPITSHLTDDISLALENSDFLIVICSPHTKESVWVQREIETFLKTHSRDKVLTVLASGEPYDVIPDILLHEDVLDPITGQIVRREIEPLSCDWRMKKRKAVREELPRLAAPLLGCAYDELRQRQRQYRMRRTIAFFSAALVASVSLMIYFIHTSIRIQRANDDLHAANEQIKAANVQIRDNLDQALRNQSEYLASAADERLEAGDRLTAIALALEALPDENGDRPYVTSAEYALNNALSAYQSEEKVVAQGAYVTDNLVKDFKVTEDGNQIYILDARNVMTVWDVDAFRKLHTLDLSGYSIGDFYITPKGNILLTVSTLGSEVACFDLEGNELWSMENGMDIAFLDQRSVLLVLYDDYQGTEQLQFLDPDTGKQVQPPLSVESEDGSTGALSFLQKDYQSGQPLTLQYYSDFSSYEVVLMDMQTGGARSVMTVDSSDGWIDAVGITQDGNVVVMCSDGSGMYNGKILNMETTGKDRADIRCFDGKTGKLLWESEIVTYVYAQSSVAEPIPDSSWMLLQSGNTFLVCDSNTGAQIAQYQTLTQPLTVSVDGESTVGILENGDFYTFSYMEDDCSALSIIDGTVSSAVLNGGLFVHLPLEMQVTGYWYDEKDEDVLLDCETALSPRACHLSADALIIDNYDELVVLDAREQKQRWSLQTGYGYKTLGFSADGSEFWMWNDYEEYAAAFSVADGTRRDLEVPMQLGEAYCFLESNMYMTGDHLLYMLESEEAMRLLRIDLQTGEILRELSLDALAPEEMTYSATARILLATDQHAWIYREEGKLFLVELENGNVRQLAEGLSMVPSVTYDEEQDQLMVGTGSELLLTTSDAGRIRHIALGDRKAVGMHFYGNQLLVLCDDGKLYRFDRLGKLLSETAMDIFSTFAYDAAHLAEDPTGLSWCATADGDLLLNIFGAGNIVDCDSWQSRAYVPDLATYVPETDTLLCVSRQQLYAYPRYTTQQQMERAREVLEGFQLTEEQRKYYGLN